MGRNTDWTPQGHIVEDSGRGVSTHRIPTQQHFIFIAVSVNWDTPTRELALIIEGESARSCLVSVLITDLKQFRDRETTALPA